MDPELKDLLGQLFAQSGEEEAPSPPPEEDAAPAMPDLSALEGMLPLLGMLGGGEEDHHVTLLRALRPYLHDGREKRVDEAIRLLRLAKLLPLLNLLKGDP